MTRPSRDCCSCLDLPLRGSRMHNVYIYTCVVAICGIFTITCAFTLTSLAIQRFLPHLLILMGPFLVLGAILLIIAGVYKCLKILRKKYMRTVISLEPNLSLNDLARRPLSGPHDTDTTLLRSFHHHNTSPISQQVLNNSLPIGQFTQNKLNMSGVGV